MTEPDYCPCGSGRAFDDCCGPLLAGTARAATAEALMRSRYTAFVRNDTAYLEATLISSRRSGFSPATLAAWNADVVWKGLAVLATRQGGPGDERGEVTFTASFEKAGQPDTISERSRFRQKKGRWYYVDGRQDAPGPAGRDADPAAGQAPSAGRNEPCPCGSGRKYKRCCGA
jgi:SEC-C motif-containing protein